MADKSTLEGPMVAWGDESARMRRVPPMYLMCGTVFEPGSEEGLAELAKAKPAGMRKLHWYDMETKEKARSLEIISQIPHWSAVAVCAPMPLGPRQERARRKCMERLLPHLEERGVEQLTLEGRWKQEDQADIDMVYALKNRRIIKDLRIEHVESDADEPRLWVPDQILGAIGDMFSGSEGTDRWGKHWNDIGNRVTLLMANI